MLKGSALTLAVGVLALAAGACGTGDGAALQSITTVPISTTVPPTTVTAPATTTTTEPPLRTTTILVLPPALTPSSDTAQYGNNGSDLQATAGSVTFYAPLSFAAPVVDLEALTIIAYDNTPGANVCVMLLRSSPLRPQLLAVGQVCTGDGPAFPQVRQITNLDPRRVDTASENAFLSVSFSGPGPSLAGVQVTYSYRP